MREYGTGDEVNKVVNIPSGKSYARAVRTEAKPSVQIMQGSAIEVSSSSSFYVGPKDENDVRFATSQATKDTHKNFKAL